MHEAELQTLSERHHARGRVTDGVRETPRTRQSYKRCPRDATHEVELQTLSGETPHTRQSYRRCPKDFHDAEVSMEL